MCKQETWTSEAHLQILDRGEPGYTIQSVVCPHLEYCIQACTPTLRRDIDLGEGTEEGNQISLVPSFRNLPYEDRLRRLNLQPLKSEGEGI